MTRAAILPTPGDPFMLRYWLMMFDKHWSKEIDKLYIYYNSPIEQDVVDYVTSMCADREDIHLIVNPKQIEHGDAINRALELVTEDLVMLIEDDAFIFKSGQVDWAFKQLESGDYDIVAGKRGSCSQEILDAAQDKWGIDYNGLGDQGPNFWPNFFFCSRQLLLKTSRDFCARAWKRGETVEPLGCVVEVPVIAGDTFVFASLELRNLVPEHRIFYHPQYHASPTDLDDWRRSKNIFDGGAPWVHIGSLSTGVGGVLCTADDIPLSVRKTGNPNPGQILANRPNTEMEKMEWERRVQWWLTFWEYSTNFEGIKDFWAAYGHAIKRLISAYGLNFSEIKQRQSAYADLGLYDRSWEIIKW